MSPLVRCRSVLSKPSLEAEVATPLSLARLWITYSTTTVWRRSRKRHEHTNLATACSQQNREVTYISARFWIDLVVHKS